jgi:hypothetical protein
MEDSGLRHSLMHNNWNYYRSFLRPDALVGHALNRALDSKSFASAQ